MLNPRSLVRALSVRCFDRMHSAHIFHLNLLSVVSRTDAFCYMHTKSGKPFEEDSITNMPAKIAFPGRSNFDPVFFFFFFFFFWSRLFPRDPVECNYPSQINNFN